VFCYTALCYAALRRRFTASTAVVARDAGLSFEIARRALAVLEQERFVRRVEQDVWRVWAVPAEVQVSRASEISFLSSQKEIPREKKESLPVRPPVPGTSTPAVTKAAALEADKVALHNNNWVALAVLGRFIRQWESFYEAAYKPAGTFYQDLQGIEHLIAAEGDLAIWCVDAIFDPAMSWVASKTLSFLTRPDLLAKHVRPTAVTLRKAAGASGSPAAGPVQAKMHIPGGGA
jgi:hypothetical protein